MTTEVLNRLTINLLTKAQYNNAVISGDINPNELYLIKDADPIGDHNSALDAHATLFAAKADRSVAHRFVLYADDWIFDDESGYYVQVVGLPGITKDDDPIADIDFTAETDSTPDEIVEGWSLISTIITFDDAIMVACFDDVPTVDIGVKLKVVY